MDGIKRCEMFRAIRKRLCENNGIPFIEEECPTPDEKCIGTCPACDYWLNRINNRLAAKRLSGEEINYSGIKEIYESYIMFNRSPRDSDLESGKHIREPEPLRGDFDVFPKRNCSEQEALEQLSHELEIMEDDLHELRGHIMPPEKSFPNGDPREIYLHKSQEDRIRLLEEFLRLEQEKTVGKEEMGKISLDDEQIKKRLETMNEKKKRCPVCGQELPNDFRVCPCCGQTL
jgi:hypothetical protein